MKAFAIAERTSFSIHIASLFFGLAGLLWVLPHPEFILQLPEIGRSAFQWSMVGGGAVYIVSGAVAMSIYGYRNLGGWRLLGFMGPAISISLSAELLGTSTGFPFGAYHYLTGLGYKIAGLVPFTIPLSWFYLGFSAYLLAYMGLVSLGRFRFLAAILFGALLLTSWDFVLDPAMSQTIRPFWTWDQPGAFFGMPYQNFAGWFGAGTIFMTVATLLWQVKPLPQWRFSLRLPLAIYMSNFAFAMLISIHGEIYPPVFLGLLLGLVPAVLLYQLATEASEKAAEPRDFEGLTAPGRGDA